MKSFDELISEALSWRLEGWDFSSLKERWTESLPPWDYREIVSGQLSTEGSLLDLGTGGGELLSSLRPLPRRTYATEGYPPNVPVAKRRLEPLGVEVIQTYGEDNSRVPQRGSIPFRNESIGLVIDRHESFVASEVFRVLKPSGKFVTQQVGSSNYRELNEALGEEEPPSGVRWDLNEAVRQLKEAGFRIVDKREALLKGWFADVGAVVCYLRAIPWQIAGFAVEGAYEELRELDKSIRQHGGFQVTATRFLVQAVKPGAPWPHVASSQTQSLSG